MNDLETFWKVLEEEASPIDLEKAVVKAGLIWGDYTYAGEEWNGCKDLDLWIRGPLGKWAKKYRNNPRNAERITRRFKRSPEYAHLYLLRMKAVNKDLEVLFGPEHFGFITYWTEPKC